MSQIQWRVESIGPADAPLCMLSVSEWNGKQYVLRYSCYTVEQAARWLAHNMLQQDRVVWWI